MKQLVILMLMVGACGREAPRTEVTAPTCKEPVQVASLGCSGHKTYQTCNADFRCMWAGLPLGCIKRVE